MYPQDAKRPALAQLTNKHTQSRTSHYAHSLRSRLGLIDSIKN
jgi:hypothetical protein